jgi:hypothetical protein
VQSTTQLPAHSLTQPLDTADEHTLRQILANTRHLLGIIAQAKECGLDVAQHEARANMHHAFATTALAEFFPTTLSTPISAEQTE